MLKIGGITYVVGSTWHIYHLFSYIARYFKNIIENESIIRFIVGCSINFAMLVTVSITIMAFDL